VDALADIEGIKQVVSSFVAEQNRGRPTRRDRELADRTIEVVAGGGAVKVRLNGLGHVIGLDLTAEVYADRDPELLADLLLGALSEAQRRAISMAASYPPDAPSAA